MQGAWCVLSWAMIHMIMLSLHDPEEGFFNIVHYAQACILLQRRDISIQQNHEEEKKKKKKKELKSVPFRFMSCVWFRHSAMQDVWKN